MMNSEYWIDESSFFGTTNHIRAMTAVKLIEELEINSIIDLGCGDQQIRKLLKREIKYTPVDIHKRSNNCLVHDLNNDYPKGNWDLAITLGVTQYIKDKELLYKRISESTKYWITSISNTGDLLGKYGLTDRENPKKPILETSNVTIRSQMRRFNLQKSIRCATGCLICLWIRKNKDEIKYVRILEHKERSLELRNQRTKKDYLDEHIKKRRDLHKYIGKLTREIKDQESKTIKRINLVIDGRLKEQLNMAESYVSSKSCSEYIHFSIGYCYNNNKYNNKVIANYCFDEWLNAFEAIFEERFCKMYIGLSPTYEVYFIYKKGKKK